MTLLLCMYDIRYQSCHYLCHAINLANQVKLVHKFREISWRAREALMKQPPGHQHPWCWLIDLANWDNCPRTSWVKIKCWKCIRTAVELGRNSFFKTLICWILKGNLHNISRISVYVGIFAWLATKSKSRLKSSDIQFISVRLKQKPILMGSLTLDFTLPFEHRTHLA